VILKKRKRHSPVRRAAGETGKQTVWRVDIRVDSGWIAGALEAAGFKGEKQEGTVVDGVTTDSRTGVSGRLFVALRGESGDGHDFIAEAASGGAAALLVETGRASAAREAAPGIPVFEVKDTLRGLQALAAAWRDRVSPKVVAITGSSGKTTVKEMTRAVLAGKYSVHATSGNFNNHIGVPLTILSMPEGTDVLVTEMGANHKGEIAELCAIARPDIGVVTNIGPSHLEFFGTLKGVAAAKSELVESLTESGAAVLPADDEFFEHLSGRTRAPVVAFGMSDKATVRIEDIEIREGGGYTFSIGGQEMEIRRFGRHSLLNAGAAAAVAGLMEISAPETAAAIAEAEAFDGRGVVFDVGGITFIDESYNSNPASLMAAVSAFMEMSFSGSRWLVLGDMLELGEASVELHKEAGAFCGKAGVDGIITLGDETVELNRAAAVQRRAPGIISHFLDVVNLASYLDSLLSEGDGVLVKGSRGMKMETVIKEIEEKRQAERRRAG
jgi:UDP-N-acetylmuramoyl-tripeptide--D-alanyl-D-alanine ligase